MRPGRGAEACSPDDAVPPDAGSAKPPHEDTFTRIGGFSMGRFRCKPFALLIAALALSLAAATRADITPEAKQVVDRYVEATGGSAARLSVRTLRARAGVSALGFSG